MCLMHLYKIKLLYMHLKLNNNPMKQNSNEKLKIRGMKRLALSHIGRKWWSHYSSLGCVEAHSMIQPFHS